MPPKLQRVEQGLRAVGAGPKVDELVRSMNAAAEEAAPEAKAILLQALREMSFSDCEGDRDRDGRTAGTEYFKRKTTEQIEVAFRPIVERTMAKTGVTQQFYGIDVGGSGDSVLQDAERGCEPVRAG